jgi:hypothetical protein
MYFYGVPLLLLQVALALHAYKSHSMRWVVVNLAVPLLGSLAYLVFRLMPDLWAGWHRRARRPQSMPTSNRAAMRSIELSPDQSIQLADEALQEGRNEQAIAIYETALAGSHPDDPTVLLKLARAYFGRRRFVEAREALDRLRAAAPFSLSGPSHLLYARVLEEMSSTNDALGEYEALCRYYDGAEAKYRYGLLLKRLGYAERASMIFGQMMNDAKAAKPTYRKTQRRWLDLAMQENLRAN